MNMKSIGKVCVQTEQKFETLTMHQFKKENFHLEQKLKLKMILVKIEDDQ